MIAFVKEEETHETLLILNERVGIQRKVTKIFSQCSRHVYYYNYFGKGLKNTFYYCHKTKQEYFVTVFTPINDKTLLR